VEHYFIFVAIILFFGITDYFSTDFVHAIFVCRNLTFITFKQYEVLPCEEVQWYGVHTKFRENVSADSRVGKGNARTDSVVMLQI